MSDYNPYQSYDRNSIIERLDPSKQIPIIIEHLLGIRSVNRRGAVTIETSYSRYNKPTFTEEFIRLLEHQLNGYVNAIFTFSRFDDKDINKRIRNIGLDLNRTFAILGNDGYIGEKSWSNIMKIHDHKFLEKGVNVSGWYKHNIQWDYNKPVTMEMLYFAKNFDENCDQDVVFQQVSHQIRRMIEASYRRSLALSDELGMMTSVLAGVTQERNATSQNQQIDPSQQMPTVQQGQQWTGQ